MKKNIFFLSLFFSGLATAQLGGQYAGTLQVKTIPGGSTTDQIVTTDTNGNIRKLPISVLQTTASSSPLGPWYVTGTSTPATSNTQDISQNGNVRALQFISFTSTYPDYVFQNYYSGESSKLDPTYKFLSLKETEKFIKEKGHLPGFTSADKIIQKGEFSISETSIKSLEKIEELYLHIIEIEKRLSEVEKENKELKSILKR